MAWPLSQDFNEAIQNPSSAFMDADLKGGKVTTTPFGVPLPRSGNYADVYQIVGADGRSWAMKCFTRPVAPDLQARYAAIARHLAQANLPFTVGFEFLPEGIRVKGRAYPALKMQWVEGFALNTFAKDNLNRAANLEAMLSLWVRLCRRLRESGMAHCDLQHGNVILVPSDGGKNSLGLKLVDYDGMFVPALAGKSPGEAGHASFQHPQRILTNDYSADLDRFPHLVVATALRGLLVAGKPLWDKYDTGDNLLFTAKDFTLPHQSRVMRELWDTGDPFTVGLLSNLVIACSKPLAQTPWLDTLMPEGRPPVLTPSQERQAMQLLGVPVAGAVPAPAMPMPAAAPPQAPPPRLDSALNFDASTRRPPRSNSTALYGAIAAGVVAAIGISIGFVAFGGKKHSASESVAATPGSSAPPLETPKPVEPPPIDPPAVKPPVDPPVKPPDPPKPPEKVIKGGKVAWSVPTNALSDTPGRMIVPAFDGSHYLVLFAKTGEITAFDAATGKPLGTFKGHEPATVAAACLPGGKVISSGKEPVMMVWDAATGKSLYRVTNRGPAGTPWALFTEPTGAYALVAAGKQAALVELDKGETTFTLDLIGSGLPGLAAAILAPDGKSVLALTDKQTLRTVAVPDGSTLADHPHKLPRAALIAAWSPAKKLAVLRQTSAEEGKGTTGTLSVVEITGGKVVKVLAEQSRCEFTADGKYLVAASAKGAVWYDTATWERAAEVPASLTASSAIALSPDGTRAVAFGGSPQNLVMVAADLPKAKPTESIPPKTVPVKVPDPAMPQSLRKPLPSDDAVKAAEAAVKETYKDFYGKKAPADRRKLAEQLLKSAAETTEDMPAKLYMLREAQGVALELIDPRLGARALEQIDATFEVDGTALRIEFIERIGAAASKTDVLRSLAEVCGDIIEELSEKAEFDKALKIAEAGLAVMTRANLPPMIRELENRLSQIRRLKEGYEPVKAALEILKKDPANADAHLTVGKYRCFVQGRWADGLSDLAAGSDDALKKAAMLDFSNDGEATEIKKAEAWWNWGNAQQDIEKTAGVARAKYWYAKVVASGKTGFDRDTAASRIAFTHDGVNYRPGLIMEVLPLGGKKGASKTVKLAPTGDIVGADYKNLPGNAIGVKFIGFLVPPTAGRYKIIADGRSRILVRFFNKPEDKTIINILDVNANGNVKDAYIVLPANKPVPLYVEAVLSKDANAMHSISLRWVRPGAKSDEAIPGDMLFHAKSSETALTKE